MIDQADCPWRDKSAFRPGIRPGCDPPSVAAPSGYFPGPLWDLPPLHRPARPVRCRGGKSHKGRSEEHTSEIQSLMSKSYAVFSLYKQNNTRPTSAPYECTTVTTS